MKIVERSISYAMMALLFGALVLSSAAVSKAATIHLNAYCSGSGTWASPWLVTTSAYNTASGLAGTGGTVYADACVFGIVGSTPTYPGYIGLAGNQTFQGAGASTILDCEPPSGTGYLNMIGMGSGAVLENVTLDGEAYGKRSASSLHGLTMLAEFGYDSNGTISGCTFQNVSGAGVLLGPYETGGNTINNCTFRSCSTGIIYNDMNSGNHRNTDPGSGLTTIENCNFTGTQYDAINLNSPFDSIGSFTIQNNTFSGCEEFCVALAHIQSCTISGNMMWDDLPVYNSGTDMEAIHLEDGCSSDTITGNTIQNTTMSAPPNPVAHGVGMEILGNSIGGNGDCNGITFTGNTVQNCSQYGVLLHDCWGITCNSNIFVNNAQDICAWQWVSLTTVNSNICAPAPTTAGGIKFYGPNSTIIPGDLQIKNNICGYTASSYISVTYDTTGANGYPSTEVTVSGNTP